MNSNNDNNDKSKNSSDRNNTVDGSNVSVNENNIIIIDSYNK